MVFGQDNLAGEKVFEYFRDNDDLSLRQFCRRKIFECFQDNDDLHLKQFCRRKSLWMFPRQWWFASKTILQVKKSWNIFSIKMVCGQDNLVGEKVFEYFRDNDDLRLRQFCRRKIFESFQDNDDLRLRQFCRRKKFWIFSGDWWFASKTTLQAKKSLNVSKIMMICV